MKSFKWQIDYNGQFTGKQFFTKKECKKELNRLCKLGLYGYTIRNIS